MSTTQHDAEVRDLERRITAARTPKERREAVATLLETNARLREEVERARPTPDPRVPAMRKRFDEIINDDAVEANYLDEVRKAAWRKVGREPTKDDRKAKAFPPELPRDVAVRRWVGLSDCGEHVAQWDDETITGTKRRKNEDYNRFWIEMFGEDKSREAGLLLPDEDIETLSQVDGDDRLGVAGRPVGVAVPLDEALSSGKGPANTMLHRLAEEMGIKF